MANQLEGRENLNSASIEEIPASKDNIIINQALAGTNNPNRNNTEEKVSLRGFEMIKQSGNYILCIYRQS